MALHTSLPIYKVAYDLVDLVVDLIKNMPREVKQVIGGELRDECLRITIFIFRANTCSDKSAPLTELIERIQLVELLLRMARDKRFISTGQYARAIQLTDRIGKQANGWRKSSASAPVARSSR